jgi:hypothetical protein
VGGPRADDTGGGSSGSPRCVKIFRIGPGSRTGSLQQPQVAKSAKARDGFALEKQFEGDQPDVAATRWALERKLLPHPGHEFRARNPGGVVRAGLCKSVAAAFRGLPASRCIALLADVPDGQRRDGPPQFVIWRKHPVLAMPVLPRRRDKVRQTIEADISAAGPSLAPTALGGRSQSHGLAGPPHRHPAGKRREFDDTVGSRPRGLPPTAPPDPVGGFVPREHVADASDPAVRAAASRRRVSLNQRITRRRIPAGNPVTAATKRSGSLPGCGLRPGDQRLRSRRRHDPNP